MLSYADALSTPMKINSFRMLDCWADGVRYIWQCVKYGLIQTTPGRADPKGKEA